MALQTNSSSLTDHGAFGAKRRSGHVKPKSIAHLDLQQPGRLRVAHMLTLLSVSHSTFYSRLKNGSLPAPDGNDPRPYWRTETVRLLLAA